MVRIQHSAPIRTTTGISVAKPVIHFVSKPRRVSLIKSRIVKQPHVRRLKRNKYHHMTDIILKKGLKGL